MLKHCYVESFSGYYVCVQKIARDELEAHITMLYGIEFRKVIREIEEGTIYMENPND